MTSKKLQRTQFSTEASNSQPSVYISIYLQGKHTIILGTLCNNINISIPQFIMSYKANAEVIADVLKN